MAMFQVPLAKKKEKKTFKRGPYYLKYGSKASISALKLESLNRRRNRALDKRSTRSA